MKTVIVSGTPGTGKTAIAKKLAKKLNFYYLDVNEQIKKHKLHESYDRKRKSKIINVSKLNKFLIKYINQFKTGNSKKYKGIVIDSHLSHHLPRKYVDLCIVAKCGINELNKRLKKRRYSKGKIIENLQAEIFDVCYNEALEREHIIFIVDTTDYRISKKAFKGMGEAINYLTFP
ncbi:adenylate kinase family protein [Candidatus Woesearchaeota archaeon]|nr:adenylate kinase family protein [Candidatus Woesearchaeota archaeon]